MKLRHFALFVASTVLCLSGVYAAAQGMRPSPLPSSAPRMPPLSWTCPMHPDVLEDKAGQCPICKMDLEPVRLVTVWKCPLHAVIEEHEAGKCKICKRDLMANTMALTFTCTANKEINVVEPGLCPDGSPMIRRHTARSHGDHNPKHGGQFFMASDSWHHIEGAYPAAGRFRLYVYDDFSKPLSAENASKVRGRIVTKEMFDPVTKTTRELAAAPLVLARDGAYFEAKIDQVALPAKMAAKVTFGTDVKESRFDFTFEAFSMDLSTPTTTTTAAPTGFSGAVAMTMPVRETPAGAIPALLADLKAKDAELGGFVKTGAFASIWVPALAGKDLALQIQALMPNEQTVEGPVKQLVLAAYRLDSVGDLGDAEKINEAYVAFSAALKALESSLARR